MPRSSSVRIEKTGCRIPAKDWVGLSFIERAGKVVEMTRMRQARQKRANSGTETCSLLTPLVPVKTLLFGLISGVYGFRASFAQLSFKVIVRLNTGLPATLSLSSAK